MRIVRSWSLWDTRVLVRALFATLLAWLVVVLVSAATDEGNVLWRIRFARSLPLVPICAGIGAWMGLASARARGELTALAALGRSPWANALGTSCGGFAVALVAALLMFAAPHVDLSGFYPTAAHAGAFHLETAGYVSHDRKWTVSREGEITRNTGEAEAEGDVSLPEHARLVAGVVTLVGGIAIPLLAALPRKKRTARSWALAVVAMGLTVLLFQAAAGRNLPTLCLPFPLLALLAYTLAKYKDTREPIG